MSAAATSLITASRGPVMLMALGALFAWERRGGTAFSDTWPALIVLFGVLKLLEHVLSRSKGGAES